MAWPKLKQYLENSWYRWASQDRQTWYAAQFQYWENINIRDMRNWVCLSGWSTDLEVTFTDPVNFFTYQNDLYAVDSNWKIYDEEWTEVYDTGETFTTAPLWIEFWNYVYIVWTTWIFKTTMIWATSDETPTWYRWLGSCVLNYANTYLLIWDLDRVWRLDNTWTPWTMIREFESSYSVFWITQEWNYVKIYTSNGVSTKIHYAKGTFDVEDTWLVQTVSFVWLTVNNWRIVSDQGNDYVMFNQVPDWQWLDWEFKLAKIQWYNKTDIKWTQTRWWQKVFWGSAPRITACDWVLFASMNEWIWTFTEYNWWLWWWCVEFATAKWVYSMFRYGEKLYVCMSDWDDWYIIRYYDMSFHPATYQNNWFIIGRVFDWGCAWLFKKNDQATITYNMPEWTSMELSYRYDRSSFEYNKSNFLPIKTLTDTINCYDIVVPTTPLANTWWLLLLENDDQILLEDWNSIWLEDLMICPFNKTWNLLEYRFDLQWANNIIITITAADIQTEIEVNWTTYVANTGSNTMTKEDIATELAQVMSYYKAVAVGDTVIIKQWNTVSNEVNCSTSLQSNTPILFEHSLTYYDYMRKYR